MEIEVDGEKVTAIVGSDDGLNKIVPSGEITFVKDILTKKVLKVLKKWDLPAGN